MKKFVIYVISALALAALLAGCTSGISESDVSYAQPMTVNMLKALDSADHDTFVSDMSETMKAAFDEQKFNSLADMISQKVGSFESLSFGQATESEQNGMKLTTIVYTANYTDEPDGVIVTVSFSESDGYHKVEGLFFNSPKLRS